MTMQCHEPSYSRNQAVCKGRGGDEVAFNCPDYMEAQIAIQNVAWSENHTVIICAPIYRGKWPRSMDQAEAFASKLVSTPEFIGPFALFAGIAIGLLLKRIIQ